MAMYFKEILDTPPSAVIDYYIDVVAELTYQFKPDSKEWIVQALQIIPIYVYTDDEKNRMVDKFETQQGSQFLRYVESEINIIYKRAKNHNRR